jgi:hypothetical protein
MLWGVGVQQGAIYADDQQPVGMVVTAGFVCIGAGLTSHAAPRR